MQLAVEAAVGDGQEARDDLTGGVAVEREGAAAVPLDVEVVDVAAQLDNQRSRALIADVGEVEGAAHELDGGDGVEERVAVIGDERGGQVRAAGAARECDEQQQDRT